MSFLILYEELEMVVPHIAHSNEEGKPLIFLSHLLLSQGSSQHLPNDRKLFYPLPLNAERSVISSAYSIEPA
jgi:hypothetical protein